MLQKDDVKELFPFFQVDTQEEILEQIGEGNVFCNFVQVLIDTKAPPMWNSDEGIQFAIQEFRDTTNREEEIVNRIVNIYDSQTENKARIEVKHKFIDFQSIQLGEKIRKLNDYIDDQFDDDDQISENEILNANLDDFKYVLDDLSIAEMMIQSEQNSEFYELEATQKIIDYQFIKARKFFLGLFLFYLICFILPCIIAYFAGTPLVTKICNCISLFSLICFGGIEICQLRKLGAEEYFFDFWNFVDFTQSLVFLV